jgi:hypothetical protein
VSVSELVPTAMAYFVEILIRALTYCQAILLRRWATNIQHFMQISVPDIGHLYILEI